MNILGAIKKEYPTLSVDFKNLLSDGSFVTLTPSELLAQYDAIILSDTDNVVHVAALDPKNADLRSYVQRYYSHKGHTQFSWIQLSKKDIREAINIYKVDLAKEIETLLISQTDNNIAIPKFIDYLIQFAFVKKASDIHIEPRRDLVKVRFRMDGILHEVFSYPITRHPAVIARLKILANLKTDEYRKPQDGRIEPEGYTGSSLRVSVIPTLFGEKIVLRVLDESSAVLDPESLGFSKKQQEIVKRNIDKPFGMIVASGPTGSGKTTSLYALLQLLKKSEVNISTLEDPIEFALDNINQTQVHPSQNFTFAEGLRSLLRQDPDVILVGEIRDHETISMASNAAMTGHLVLTSLHTNDAPSAFSRFMEMGVDDFMVASVLNLVIAQRLVRKICENCKEERILDPVILKKINERKDVCDSIEKEQPGLLKKLEKIKFTYGKGCDACLSSGYSGRIGIFELLEVNKEIHDLILSHAASEDIRAAAAKGGFENMIQDGVGKVLKGDTTFEEVMRTTRNS